MLERLRRDETGVAMGLTVIMIVLIGVMGAGLLVFVRNDLEAVIGVNEGQRAMDIADAGAQAAKAQLLADKIPAHYDVDGLLSQVFHSPLCNIDASDVTEEILRNPQNENWSPEAGGQTRSFGGGDGQFNVTIRWMTWNPLAPSECRAPVTSLTGVLPGNADYFKVVSTGKYGSATRRVEAIYETYDLNAPRAYYTPGPITVSGTACIDSVSLFSLSSVTFNGSGGCRNVLGLPSHMKGTDLAYKAWAETLVPTTSYPNKFNMRARPTADAGVGTAGVITGSPREGTRDFDSTPLSLTTPKFVQAPSANPQSPNEITFPFDLGSQPDANRLCDEAKAQPGNYHRVESPGIFNLDTWPDNSSHNTVVCYDFTNPASNTELRWSVPGEIDIATGSFKGCKFPKKKGTLVVRRASFTIQPNTALFEGVVVVRGPADQESEIGSTDEITGLSGNTCLDGFVNSTGPINITGTVTPSGSVEVNNRPGFYGVRLWSWRELYE